MKIVHGSTLPDVPFAGVTGTEIVKVFVDPVTVNSTSMFRLTVPLPSELYSQVKIWKALSEPDALVNFGAKLTQPDVAAEPELLAEEASDCRVEIEASNLCRVVLRTVS